MDLEFFGTGTEAEEGKWFDMGDRASVKVRSEDSEYYAKVLSRILARYPNYQKLPRKTQEKIMCSAMAEGILVDWKGVTLNGEELEPTKENKEKALLEFPVFRRYVSDLAGSLANFQSEVERD